MIRHEDNLFSKPYHNENTLFDVGLFRDSFVLRKKVLLDPQLTGEFSRTQHTPYTEASAAQRLSLPNGYASRDVFSSPAAHVAPEWTSWHQSSLHGNRRETVFPNYIQPPVSRKAYEGPLYLQSDNPTCNAWAILHAMLISDVHPPVDATRELLNLALPRDDGTKGGVSTFTAAGMIGERPDVGADFMILGSRHYTSLYDRQYSSKKIADLIKRTIDANGAIVAVVNTESSFDSDMTPGFHAVCVAGYDVSEQGYMDLQIVDSAYGEFPITVEGLTSALSRGLLTPPLMAVTKTI